MLPGLPLPDVDAVSLCVCACVRVCVCARARVCARVRVCAFLYLCYPQVEAADVEIERLNSELAGQAEKLQVRAACSDMPLASIISGDCALLSF